MERICRRGYIERYNERPVVCDEPNSEQRSGEGLSKHGMRDTHRLAHGTRSTVDERGLLESSIRVARGGDSRRIE